MWCMTSPANHPALSSGSKFQATHSSSQRHRLWPFVMLTLQQVQEAWAGFVCLFVHAVVTAPLDTQRCCGDVEETPGACGGTQHSCIHAFLADAKPLVCAQLQQAALFSPCHQGVGPVLTPQQQAPPDEDQQVVLGTGASWTLVYFCFFSVRIQHSLDGVGMSLQRFWCEGLVGWRGLGVNTQLLLLLLQLTGVLWQSLLQVRCCAGCLWV